MTENEIKDKVTNLFNAIHANDDPTVKKIGADLFVMVLTDLHRMADAWDRLAKCETDGVFQVFDQQ